VPTPARAVACVLKAISRVWLDIDGGLLLHPGCARELHEIRPGARRSEGRMETALCGAVGTWPSNARSADLDSNAGDKSGSRKLSWQEERSDETAFWDDPR
jgi:hypothetical protein